MAHFAERLTRFYDIVSRKNFLRNFFAFIDFLENQKNFLILIFRKISFIIDYLIVEYLAPKFEILVKRDLTFAQSSIYKKQIVLRRPPSKLGDFNKNQLKKKQEGNKTITFFPNKTYIFLFIFYYLTK